MMASVNQIAAQILTVQTDFVRMVPAFLVTVEKAPTVMDIRSNVRPPGILGLITVSIATTWTHKQL